MNAILGSVPLTDNHGKPVLDIKGNQVEVFANSWLDKKRGVEQMTWAPGKSLVIRDQLVTSGGGWVKEKGVACFNLYLPPTIQLGDADKAGPWVDHVRKVYPSEADHLFKWFAQRVQHPDVKINHGLLLGGAMGIGKDTLLEPVKQAVGSWNFEEVSPIAVMGRFNTYAKSVILRVSEIRDQGDIDRYAFYDHLKTLMASPPDVLRVDEKHIKEYYVLNCTGVILTTNYKTDGIYLPADDRRHFVAWSDLVKTDFSDKYWQELWDWYDGGGYNHVAAHLSKFDISDFNPKAPPPKTEAFWAIVDANRAPGDFGVGGRPRRASKSRSRHDCDGQLKVNAGVCVLAR